MRKKYFFIAFFILFSGVILQAYSKDGISLQFSDLENKKLVSIRMPYLSIAPFSFHPLLASLRSRSMLEASIESVKNGFGISSHLDSSRNLSSIDESPFSFLISAEAQDNSKQDFSFRFAGKEDEEMLALHGLFQAELSFYRRDRYYEKNESEVIWRASIFFSFYRLLDFHAAKAILENEAWYLEGKGYFARELLQIAIENSFLWDGGYLLTVISLSTAPFLPVGVNALFFLSQKIYFFEFLLGLRGVSKEYYYEIGRKLNPSIEFFATCEFQIMEGLEFAFSYSRRDLFFEPSLALYFPMIEKFEAELNFFNAIVDVDVRGKGVGEVDGGGVRKWDGDFQVNTSGLILNEEEQKLFAHFDLGVQFNEVGRVGYDFKFGIEFRYEKIIFEFEVGLDGYAYSRQPDEWDIEPIVGMSWEMETRWGLVKLGLTFDALKRGEDRGWNEAPLRFVPNY